MARPVCVAAELLELEQSPLLQAVRDAGTHSRVVLVHVYALEFDELWCESEKDIYTIISKFIIVE